MQQYIYGNIGHKAYAYVSSEPEFFANAQRAAVLSHLMSYDVFCPHGDLLPEQHQSFWMVTSNLDNPSAPNRLYLQASGGDPHRTGFYVRGYMSDNSDGYLYDSNFLQLLQTAFTGFEQTMKEAEENSLKQLDRDQIPVAPIAPAELDAELLRCILLALLRKKKVIIRIPAVGAAAMALSRAYVLAIYQRLPYEQRKVNGFVTGISAAKFHDKNALPASVNLMLMDADADLGGMTTDMFQEVFDLADPAKPIRPMVRENKGKKLGYVDLMDFLAERSPEVLDDYFRFCRSCIRTGVDGSNLGIQDYAMYLDFFNIGGTAFTDDAIRNWAANIYINARNNEKWTPEVKDALFERITGNLPAEQLEQYLCAAIGSFGELKTLGVLAEGELKRIRSSDADTAVLDENEALTLSMTEALLKFYPEGTRERLERSLTERFVTFACQQYPCLTETMPTGATVGTLTQIELTFGKKTTALAAAVREKTIAEVTRLRDGVCHIYETNYNSQHSTGLDRIARWFTEEAEELSDLYGDLKQHYLWEELLDPDGKSGWNAAIAQRLTDVCRNLVALTDQECAETIGYMNRSCRYFQEQKGRFSGEERAQILGMTDGWQFLMELHGEGLPVTDRLAAMDRLEILYRNYPKEARNILVRTVVALCTEQAKSEWSCLTEQQPRKATVEALRALPLTSPEEEPVHAGAALRKVIIEQISSLRTGVEEEYQRQYASQHSAGLDRIAGWKADSKAPLQTLYGDLKQHYLWEELLIPGKQPNWNGAIAQSLADRCSTCQPETLEEYRDQLTRTEEDCRFFTENGGVLSDEQTETISKAKENWHGILVLADKACTNVPELLELYDQVKTLPVSYPVGNTMKIRFTDRLLQQAVTREQIFSNWKRICQGCQDPMERELLSRVVHSCAKLHEVPAMPVQKLITWLKVACKLLEAGLLTQELSFLPWKTSMDPRKLLVTVTAYEDYHVGKEEPDLSNALIRTWAAESLQENADLMFLLARDYPKYRTKLIPILAGKSGAVTQDQVLALYVAGCSQALLRQGAGEDTAASWRQHLDTLFPGWVDLPAPVELVLPSGLEKLNLLVIAGAVLLAIAGVVPAAVLLLMGAGSMLTCICVLAVTAVLALLLLAAGFLVKKRGQKRFLLTMALALVPGVAASVACFVMNLG